MIHRHDDVDRGRVWGFVPGNADTAAVGAFESGGVYPLKDSNLTREAENWLRGLLTEGDDARLLLVLHPAAKPSDGWLETRPDQGAVFCGEDVYEYFSPEDRELARRPSGATWFPHIGVIAPAPESLDDWNRRTLSPAVISEIAAQTPVVIVGAWDDEGWIVWEPDRTAAQVPAMAHRPA